MSEDPHKVEIGEWARVNPLSMLVNMVRTGGQALIPIAFAIYSVGSDGDASGWLILVGSLAALALVGIAAGVGWLQWYRLRYRIGESDVRVEQGIISRQARSVPYDRIQDVSLEQKLIPRMLGLVEVKFETGAGGKDELKLAFVSEAEGERLRETVRALVEGADVEASALLPEASEEPVGDSSKLTARTLFAMGPRRLFTYGLFSFSLVIFAVILGAAQQFEFLLPFDIWDWVESWIKDERYAEAGNLLDSYGTGARIVAALYAILTIIIVGMASGVVTVFVRDWGFLLERTAKGFRRRRGLLTKTDVVMPVHRVQALVVKTGWLRRRFGWHGLSFISLAQDSGNANHDVAPFAQMEEIAPIAGEAGFSLPGEEIDWCRPSPNFYFVRGVVTSLFLLVITSVWAIATNWWWLLGAAIALVALEVFAQWYKWRVERHALDEAQVLSRRGWLAPRLQIANRVKLHSASITQGPLARWLGYCDLHLGLAGGTMAFRGLERADAYRLRAGVLESIARTDFAKLPR